MSHNVILVVLDGLSYQVAQHALGICRLTAKRAAQHCTSSTVNSQPCHVRCMKRF